jgi:hypothetical protein
LRLSFENMQHQEKIIYFCGLVFGSEGAVWPSGAERREGGTLLQLIDPAETPRGKLFIVG